MAGVIGHFSEWSLNGGSFDEYKSYSDGQSRAHGAQPKTATGAEIASHWLLSVPVAPLQTARQAAIIQGLRENTPHGRRHDSSGGDVYNLKTHEAIFLCQAAY